MVVVDVIHQSGAAWRRIDMERLTNKNLRKACNDPWDYCGLDNVCKRNCFKPSPCKIPEIVDRLAAYEDTGLEPEEVRRCLEFEDICLDEYIKYERLHELAQADREGLCGIPPVKLHQRIFRVFNGEIYEEIVCDAIWRPLMPRPRWKVFVMGCGLGYYWDDVFGKTVFLTREEAEAALEGMKNG